MAGIEDLSAEDQRLHRLGKLLFSAAPDIVMDAKRLAKRANPALVIPELDIEDKLAAQEKAFEERVSKLTEEQMTERVNRLKAERDRQIKDAGFTPEEIEKIIVEEKCSYDTAMKLATLQRQTAEPAPGNALNPPHTPIDMRPDKEVRKLQGSALRRWSADQAHAMVDELRGRRIVR